MRVCLFCEVTDAFAHGLCGNCLGMLKRRGFTAGAFQTMREAKERAAALRALPPDCTCPRCAVAALSDEDRDWLKRHGWDGTTTPGEHAMPKGWQ